MHPSTPVLLCVDFPFTGPWGKELAGMLDPLARQIAASPGLRWKLWTENSETRRAGGVYLFDDEAHARSYLGQHLARLGSLGITDVQSAFYTLNEDLNRLTAANPGA